MENELQARIIQQIQELTKPIEVPESVENLAENPPDMGGFYRQLVHVPPPPPESVNRPALQEVQKRILPTIYEYLNEPDPGGILLFVASPGTGKTTAAVAAAEWLAAKGHRVLYAGPRHDFFMDVIGASKNPALYYEWLPRQAGDEYTVETCRYTPQMNSWLSRNYEAMDFCKQACGWNYITNLCPYHLQKRRQEPIIYGNHRHLFGHPLEFNVLIGDEDPTATFTHPWAIPAKFIRPDGMSGEYADILTKISQLSEVSKDLQGPLLLDALGGAEYVYQVIERFAVSAASVLPPVFSDPAEVDELPYWHIFDTALLLKREAGQARWGADYPHRIALAEGYMNLFLRRQLDWSKLPKHVIWMDATANPRAYQACFQREVYVVDAQPKIQGRIFQVVDRANNKSNLVGNTQTPTKSNEQAQALTRQIIQTYQYKKPAIITFAGMEEKITLENVQTGHFYAARGTNQYEDCDALILIGTPQASLTQLELLAKMIFFEQNAPFNRRWSSPRIPEKSDDNYPEKISNWMERGAIGRYNYIDPQDGEGRAYPVSGFWNDEKLNAVLWSNREAEIIQAAHRVRPVRRDVDIWLLTNIPIKELPPTHLMFMRDILGAPQGVNIFEWQKFIEAVENIEKEYGIVVTKELVEKTDIHRETIRKYVDILLASGEWEKVEAIKRSPGRPSVAIVKKYELEKDIEK